MEPFSRKELGDEQQDWPNGKSILKPMHSHLKHSSSWIVLLTEWPDPVVHLLLLKCSMVCHFDSAFGVFLA